MVVVEVAISYDNLKRPSWARRGHEQGQVDYSRAQRQDVVGQGVRPVTKPRHSIDLIKPEAIDSTISLAAFDMNTGTGGARVPVAAAKRPRVGRDGAAISHCEKEVDKLKNEFRNVAPECQ